MTRDRLTEDCAKAIYAYVVGVRRYQAMSWDKLDDSARAVYLGMARVAIGTMHAHNVVFGKPTRGQRLRVAWERFKVRHLIADDPWEKELDRRAERKTPSTGKG